MCEEPLKAGRLVKSRSTYLTSGDGEAELEAARRSRSSRRFFSFFPLYLVSDAWYKHTDCGMRTVVSLGNTVLNSPPLSEIRNLGPILVRVRAGAESTAGGM